MALKVFKNKGETNSIPINANNLNYNFTEILNLVYPIGRGFIDFTDTDYSNYLGFTWERELIGMTPIGLDVNDNDFNTIGKTGGAKTHNHFIPFGFDEGGGMYYAGDSNFLPMYGSGIFAPVKRGTGNIPNLQISANENGRYATTSLGNNLQPYQIVAYWKRIV